ncbi:MAG: hypothetical protein HKP48_06140 [Winogradskyella sp.]|uniref:hypothetical protein n=1 Tax=Winogradskyella sp. TaxID=1883156 RepID=UPI0018228A34|nr:hypothetical protein [Winogradskyella sp.]MBT8245099.1 hypothetical protein [Winogradskyella sp.]NNK22874.1 hypothetical protein [Winogradskyella sp.]
MLLKKTNIEEKLQRLKRKNYSEDSVLEAVKSILEKDNNTEYRILDTINSGKSTNINSFDFELLETEYIYHIDQIKSICIDYRLRFLDTKYFKGKLPYEAISKIKAIEKAHDTELKGFKIIAPSKLFKLENADDPLLFAPIGNGYYYLVHKWGNDLSPFRKLLMWPYKNFGNLIFTVFIMSILATALFPEGIFSNKPNSSQAGMIFFFIFKSIAAMVIYYGFAAGKNFNKAIWDSKYYNA